MLTSSLRANDLLGYDDLRNLVNDLARADRRTHQELADVLEVSRHTVSGAASRSGPGVFKMQVRLLELLTDYTLDFEVGPLHRLIRKPKQ